MEKEMELLGIGRKPKKGRTKTAVSGIIMFLMCMLGFQHTVFAREEQQPVIVEYYYYSACDNCTEGEYYAQELKESIGDAVSEHDYKIVLEDVNKKEVYDKFIELTEDQKTESFTPDPPLLKVGDTYLFGIDEIMERARDVVIEAVGDKNGSQETIVNSLKGIDENDSFLVYFYIPGCDDCQKVQKYFDTIDKTYYYGDEKKESQLKIAYINLGEFENVPLAQWFYDKYGVAEKDRKAPVVFYQNGYLQGFQDIKDYIPVVLQEGDAKGWQDITYTPQKAVKDFTPANWGVLVMAGLANGFNPCGLSMLFMLLSLLLVRKEKILLLGTAFIGAKMLTYLLLGTVFSSFIGQLGGVVTEPVIRAVKIILGVFLIILAFLSFADLYFASQEKYGKLKLQLPGKLKKFNSRYLETVMEKGGKSLTGMIFVAGIVVSAGELLCTGQLYLASILYVMEKEPVFNWSVFLMFVVYLLCMCLPLLIFTAVGAKGVKMLRLSELVRKRMPLIKLCYAILFICFAVVIMMSL